MKRWLWIGCLVSCLVSCKREVANNVQETPLDKGVYPLESDPDLDALLNEVGEARYVLLGEASHGTSEYYTWRARITRRLIEEKGFTMVAVEGDWPDMYAYNRYVKGGPGAAGSAREVMQTFNRWPTWMWSNQEVGDFIEWLKTRNASLPATQRVGFYGLDVYSLWESVESVLSYLDKVDPAAAQRARAAYTCLASYQRDEQAFAVASVAQPNLCAQELQRLLTEVRATIQQLPSGDEEAFSAEQNALAAIHGADYYRMMVRDDVESWNIRDRHMAETIARLTQWKGPSAKIAVWEHNTHVGDARATNMQQSGMVNVGQLVREQHGPEGVYIVGFGSYRGSVIAARSWEAGLQTMPVPASPGGTWESLLHQTPPANKLVLLRALAGDARYARPLGHRAIGVVYDPQSEGGNYVPSVVPQRYDAFVFIDQTHALHPLPTGSGRKVSPKSQYSQINDF